MTKKIFFIILYSKYDNLEKDDKMKIFMFMGIPSSNNLQLANYLQIQKYPNSLIFNRDYIKIQPNYSDLPNNSPIIDFAFIRYIKNILVKNPKDCIMIVAPFILKESRECFYEAFKDAQFTGIWVERRKEELMINNSLQMSCFQETEEEIDYYLKYKVSPTPDEPFKDIAYITREINTGMSKTYPYVTDLETLLIQL